MWTNAKTHTHAINQNNRNVKQKTKKERSNNKRKRHATNQAHRNFKPKRKEKRHLKKEKRKKGGVAKTVSFSN